jgi:pimeloyl-ACP methyl ester carboxylesterase
MSSQMNSEIAFLSLSQICLSFFISVDNIGKVESPILIIHGTNDRVVPIAHAYELHKRCQNPVLPLWVQGAGHDDIYTFEEYLTRLKKFIDIDLSKPSNL